MEGGLLETVAFLLVAILLRVSGIESSLRNVERQLKRDSKRRVVDEVGGGDGGGLDGVDPGEAK